jgi:uncharacterized protein YcbX
MARVSRLFVYPIKSCAGIELAQSELTPRGLEFDRRYMLVDADGRFLTQRRHPQMALIRIAFADGGFRVSAPGRDDLLLPLSMNEPGRETCPVRVWDDTIEATLAEADVNVWFSAFMGFACGLVYLADHQHRAVPNAAADFDDEVGFADGAPLLLVSEAALAALNDRLERPVGIERFRPNIVVSECQSHAEDNWQRLAIGDAVLDVAWPCSRCVIPNIDPETGRKDPDNEPTRTLLQYRRRDRAVYFGQNLIPRTLGSVAVGDDCLIEEKLSP